MAPRTRCECIVFKLESTKKNIGFLFLLHSNSKVNRHGGGKLANAIVLRNIHEEIYKLSNFHKERHSLLNTAEKDICTQNMKQTVYLLSGDQSKINNFRKTLKTSLRCHGEKELSNKTYLN